MRRGAVLLIISAMALLIGPIEARAGKQVRALTNTDVFQVTDNDSHAIPLTEDGSTSKTVKLFGTTIIVSYNAECTAQGPDGSYLSVSILVDGKPTDPDSETNSTFCSPTSNASHVYMAVVKNGVVSHVAGGDHTFQVIGTGVDTTLWQVHDMILTIISF